MTFSAHPCRHDALRARVPSDRPATRGGAHIIELYDRQPFDCGICPECGCCHVYDWDDGLGPRCAGTGCDGYDHCELAALARESGQGHATRDDARAGWEAD